ncbi:MAG: hypothetical protein PHR35_14145, partial [Kiritimatiellae bacterium]|nr:hypothetical protein [Kiritimatiellia bacterium]
MAVMRTKGTIMGTLESLGTARMVVGHGMAVLVVCAWAAAATGETVRVERPLGIADAGGCAFYRSVLSLPRGYVQGPDGRVVLEAEDAVPYNIGAEATVSPFATPERQFIGTDRRASLERYISVALGAKWERSRWTFTLPQPTNLTTWHRIFVVDVGEVGHTETVNEKGGERIVTFSTTNANDALFHRWQWVKGKEHALVAGNNTLELNWRNSARLDQVALLPAGVMPDGNAIMKPTFGKTVATATAIMRPVKLAANERVEQLTAQVDKAGGEVAWGMSRDGGKTWKAIETGAELTGPEAQGPGDLLLKVTLSESAAKATPLVQGARLAVVKPRSAPALGVVPSSMQFSENSVALVPATWDGLRLRGGAWTLMEPVQADNQGMLWLDAAKADFMDLLPASRSWKADVAGSASGQAVRMGMLNRNILSFDVNVPQDDTYRPWFRVQMARDKATPEFQPRTTYQFDREPLVTSEARAQGTNYPAEAFWRREWVWVPGTPVEVKAGARTFRFRGGLDHTWLDRVCLAPTNAPAPAGTGGASTRAAVSTATVTFQPLDPIMARSWASIQSNPSIPTGLLAYSYSKDGGATWTGLKDAALDAVGTGATVTLRCTV